MIEQGAFEKRIACSGGSGDLQRSKRNSGFIFKEGDPKTPPGVYSIIRFIESSKLPDLYGNGAFPVNYPNIGDRRNGQTGHGICLHGTPNEFFSRSPEDSNAGNSGSKVDWINGDEWQLRRKNFAHYIEKWRKDREGRDTD